jgi:TonB-dependent receptor
MNSRSLPSLAVTCQSFLPQVCQDLTVGRGARTRRLLLAAVCAATFPALLPRLEAQAPGGAARAEAATGAISGRVQSEVTGQYLLNVRLTVKGTALTAFTDTYGTFRLAQVPSGKVTLEVFYSGLDVQTVTLDLSPGQSIEQNFSLTTRAAYGDKPGVVQLDPFVLASSRLTEGEALATNEQRFAPNIKNVVATDAFGDVPEGNIAEFMRFLPGVTVGYEDEMPTSVGIRGFSGAMTNVMTDGAMLANSARIGSSREFDFIQVSINNVSRIEVTKVPTPANPASGISGSVNMVSKNSFERSRAQLNYRVSLAGHGDNLNLSRQPFPFDTSERPVKLGFDVDYTLPVSKNFGLVVTALQSFTMSDQDSSNTTWNATAAGTGATPERPFLQTHTILKAPKWRDRNSAGLKLDWRVSPNSVLTLGMQANYYRYVNGNLQRTSSVGTNAVSSIAGGLPLTFGENFARSATGRGTVGFGSNFLHDYAKTLNSNLRYRYQSAEWLIDAGANASKSITWRRTITKGHFNSFGSGLLETAGVRVNFEDIRPEGPAITRAFDASNREIDLFDLRNFRLNTSNSGTYRNYTDDTAGLDLNVKRRLSVLRVPVALQAGGLLGIQDRDHRRESYGYTYNPANPADPTLVPFRMQVYRDDPNYWLGRSIPWASPNRMVEAWGRNPGLFTQTAAQAVASAQAQINGSETFKEITTGIYLQGEARLFNNRLTALAGVRFEKIHTKAQGPLFEPGNAFARTATGAFDRTPTGARKRRPEAGLAGSIEELRLVRTELGQSINGGYQDYYPSVHLTYNATANLLFRAAYALTYGKPDYGNLIPNTTITENDVAEGADPSVLRGTLSVSNPKLKPWKADNFDLSAEYYTDAGGVFSVGVYRKDIAGFFDNRVALATAADLEALGIEPEYVGWMLTTTVNGGDARVDGIEFNVRQSLQPLGRWFRFFSVFANATKLKLKGSRTAAFGSMIPENVNWGCTFTRNPVTVMLKWNARGEQRFGAVPAMGPDAGNYQEKRTTLDLNATYQFNRRLSLFLNGRNILDVNNLQLRYGSQTPGYAKIAITSKFGVMWAAGLKGTF